MNARTRGAGLAALVGAGILGPSCGASRDAPAVDLGGGASTAAPRIAELRARFGSALGPPVVTRFEAVPSEGAATHVRAVLAEGARRGVTRPANVALPLRATGEVKLEDERSHLAVRFALQDVQNAPLEVAEGMALYRRALAVPGPEGPLHGADVVHRVHAEGTEDFVVFEARPAHEEIVYAVDASRVPGLRLVSNTLEFLDDAGTPCLRVAPPYVVSADGERHEARLAVSGCPYDTSPAAPWGRKVTPPGASPCTLRVAWGGSVAYPAMVDPMWTATGSMATPRLYHTASVLPTGKVLVTGGFDLSVYTSSAELYDPAGNAGAGTFAATGNMMAGRGFHTASVLSTGKVLVAGGRHSPANNDILATAELYDPAGNAGAGTFAATGNMMAGRGYHTASVLSTGKVLVAGGGNDLGFYAVRGELFDPAANGGAGAFAATGLTRALHVDHTASVLPSGKVLLAGGDPVGDSAELFDPAGAAGTGTFVATGSMATTRKQHTATVLSSGKVLMAGGGYGSAGANRKCELFDPAGSGGAGAFTAAGPMAAGRELHLAATLSTGRVVIAGGRDAAGAVLSVELFDPASGAGAGTFTAVGPMTLNHSQGSATSLPSGRVLVAGGLTGGDGSLARFAEVLGGAAGEPCTASAYCVSGFCADGVCCNAPCGVGACDRCDLPGSEGVCRLAPAGNPGAAPACAPYVCDGVKATCPTACTSDATCAPTSYCDPGGVCQPRRQQASPCNLAADCKAPGCRVCASGFCADGFCCDKACRDVCHGCARARTQDALPDGTCGPIKDGTDPNNECPASGTACGADGMCDGTGACRVYAPARTRCDGDGKVCDGKGTCALPGKECDGDHTITATSGEKTDCTPYKCENNGSCRPECTSVSDCVSPAICDPRGKCTAPPDIGSTGCSIATLARPGSDAAAASLAVVCALAGLVRRRRDGARERSLKVSS